MLSNMYHIEEKNLKGSGSNWLQCISTVVKEHHGVLISPKPYSEIFCQCDSIKMEILNYRVPAIREQMGNPC